MYRSYFQFSSRLIKNLLSHNQLTVSVSHENFIQKRWAGHSKWANIRHTKAANDLSKSAAFQKLSGKIGLAVREGGDDPAGNIKLRALMEEAKKLNMPNTTLQNAIKNAKMVSSEKPYWILYVSPSGLSIAFEVSVRSAQHAISKLSQHTKRLFMKHEKRVQDFYQERGLIVCNAVEGVSNVYDKALEDAIDIGIDEVFENDDKSLLFECMPSMLDAAYKKLENKGYTVLSATCELNFNNYVKIDKETQEKMDMIIDLTRKNFPGLLRISTNVQEE